MQEIKPNGNPSKNPQSKQDKKKQFPLIKNDIPIDKYIERKRSAFHREWNQYMTDYYD